MSKSWFRLSGVLIGAFCLVFSVAAVSDKPKTNPRLAFINKARFANGLPVFKPQVNLALSSKAHCQYAKENKQCNHHEDSGLLGFTGEWPGDRAEAKGYPARSVSEATALFDNWLSATENLMSGIYHRAGLLRFDGDEMGISMSRGVSGPLNCYCTLSGNSIMRKLCSDSSKQGEYGVWGFCRDEGLKFTEEEYDEAVNGLMKAGPEFAIYPYEGQGDVLPIFENVEVPSPLPGIDMSGMPVSIHFNPYKFKDKEIKIRRFTLRDKSKGNVSLYSQFDITTDPERHNEGGAQISRFDFAWFPIYPLRWNQQYLASLTYVTVDKQGVISPEKSLSWRFKTRKAPHTIPENDRIVVIEKGDQSIKLKKHKPVTLIFEAGSEVLPSPFASVSVVGEKISFEGVNVIRFTPTGSGSLIVRYRDNSQREITIKVK